MPFSVTLFNPTATTFVITVNGNDQIWLPGTGPDDNWAPRSSEPIPRSRDGQPAPGQFAIGTNHVTAMAEAARGQAEVVEVNVPEWLQPVNDLQLHFFYASQHLRPDFMLLWQGGVLDYEIANLVADRPVPVKPADARPGQATVRPMPLKTVKR